MRNAFLFPKITDVMLRLSRVGPDGAAGLFAARSAVAASRCAAEVASLRTACAREQWKKAEPATLSPALAKSATGARVCVLLLV